MTLKVGIIGVGGIARTHMPGWAASEHAEVVAGSDINELALQKWANDHSVQKLYTKAEDILNDPGIDIIDICTPNRYHAPLAIAALRAGKHVICEKPLAPTPAEIRDMIAARDEAGKLLMTAQHFRFKGNSRALKAEIDQGTLGDIYHARSWMLRRAAFLPGPGFVLKQHSGGGATIDIGVHILDLTLWMMGNPKPIAVSGIARTELAHMPGQFSVWSPNPIPPEWDVEEFAAAFVRFENGATLILEVSWLLHHDTQGEDMQMWLYGTRGGSHWPNAIIYSTHYETRQHINQTLQITRDTVEPHALECIEFASAVAEGAPSPVPPEQSLQVLTILDGIYRSQTSGKEVRLDL
ncbi:MAG: Gfo/Idh/MocA family oxidoreductase [Anaerolineae bacterium]|nr:Gfo/Idh/MocA family oxidoreductase [Anaerolineae bacterium]